MFGTLIIWPTWSVFGLTPGFRAWIAAASVLYLPAMIVKVSPPTMVYLPDEGCVGGGFCIGGGGGGG